MSFLLQGIVMELPYLNASKFQFAERIVI